MKMTCIIKRKLWLIIGASILLVLNGVAIGLLLNDGTEKLPPANYSSITLSFRREEVGDDGKMEIGFDKYTIPMETELFSDYATLLSKLKLYPNGKEVDPDINRALYQIMYTSGSGKEYQSIRVLFNEDSAYFKVSINEPGAQPVNFSQVYTVKNAKAWQTALCELLLKSENYKAD